MEPGTFEETTYIVQYYVPDRSEGGPTVTRHFDIYQEALMFADGCRIAPEVTWTQVWKQESTIKRTRLH